MGISISVQNEGNVRTLEQDVQEILQKAVKMPKKYYEPRIATRGQFKGKPMVYDRLQNGFTRIITINPEEHAGKNITSVVFHKDMGILGYENGAISFALYRRWNALHNQLNKALIHLTVGN